MLALQIDTETARQPQESFDSHVSQKQGMAFETWGSYASQISHGEIALTQGTVHNLVQKAVNFKKESNKKLKNIPIVGCVLVCLKNFLCRKYFREVDQLVASAKELFGQNPRINAKTVIQIAKEKPNLLGMYIRHTAFFDSNFSFVYELVQDASAKSVLPRCLGATFRVLTSLPQGMQDPNILNLIRRRDQLQRAFWSDSFRDEFKLDDADIIRLACAIETRIKRPLDNGMMQFIWDFFPKNETNLPYDFEFFKNTRTCVLISPKKPKEGAGNIANFAAHIPIDDLFEPVTACVRLENKTPTGTTRESSHKLQEEVGVYALCQRCDRIAKLLTFRFFLSQEPNPSIERLHSIRILRRYQTDLHEKMDSARPLTIDQIIQVAIDIIEGAFNLHSLNYVHRDISLPNIFLDKDQTGRWRASLGDLERVCKRAGEPLDGLYYGGYSAVSPETLLTRDVRAKIMLDQWAIGSVFYSMLERKNVPWHAYLLALYQGMRVNPEEVAEKIYEKIETCIEMERQRLMLQAISKQDKFRLIYCNMLRKDPKERYSLERVYEELKAIAE